MNKRFSATNQLLTAAFFSTLLFTVACNSAPPPQPVSTSSGTAIPASALPKGSGKPSETAIESVQNLLIPKHEGGALKLSEFRGQVVIVDFWGTWCAPCRKQAPQLAALNKRYRDKGLTVLGLSLDDQKQDQKLVNDFVKQVGINYTIAYPSRIISDAFLKGTEDETGQPPIPQLFIFGKDGKVIEHLVGERPGRGLEYLEQIVTQQLSTN